MANNVLITPGAGDTVAAEDITAVKYQLVKLVDATATSTARTGVAANPLQVSLANTATNATAVKVDGSAVTQPASLASVPSHDVTNAGTFAVQATIAAGATTIGKAEDAAHVTSDVGVMALAVRNAAVTDLSVGATDGDYEPLQVGATGRLWTSSTIDAALPAGTNAIGKLAANSGVDIGDVDITSIAAGDNNIGNVDIVTMPAVTVGTMTNLTESLVDDAAFTPATSRVLPVGFTFDDTLPDSVNEGDIGAARMSANRNLYTTIRDAAGNERGVNVNASSQLSVSVDAALPAGTNAIGKLAANSGVDIGDVDVLTLPNVTLAAGTNTNEVVGDVAQDVPIAGNPLSVGARASTAVPTAMSLDGDSVFLWADLNGALRVAGRELHDSVATGAPVRTGRKAETSPKGITLVADGDITEAYADADGIPIVKLGTSGADSISERVADTAGTSTAFTNFSAVAGTFNYITSVTIHNSHASTNGYVDFRDGSAGSVIWTFPAPATGGTTHNFSPPLKQPTAATALAYDVSAAISTVYISVAGFQSKV